MPDVVVVAVIGLVSTGFVALAGLVGPARERKAIRDTVREDLRYERAERLIKLIRENRYDPTRENERAMANAHMGLVAVLRTGERDFEKFLVPAIDHIKLTAISADAKPVDEFGRIVFAYLRGEVKPNDLKHEYPSLPIT